MKKNEETQQVVVEEEAGTQIQEITDDDFLEGKERPTVEYIRNGIEDLIEHDLYDILKENGGGVHSMVYIRRVRGHVEICPIKKLEIIH